MSEGQAGGVAGVRARMAAAGIKDWMLLVGVALLAALIATVLAVRSGAEAPPPGSDQFTAAQRKAIEAIARQYILDNGDIIPQAMQRLQDREVTKLLDSNRAEIETPYAGAWAGAKDGDVVLVEFYDYACPYCRSMSLEVARLLKEDKKLKVVWRDFPVLGPGSEEAALASLSAARQGRYRAFHQAMYAQGRPTHENIIDAVRRAGLSELQTARDMNGQAMRAEIRKNHELGRALGLTGTPAYIIGDRVLSGAVGYDGLKQAIEAARASG